MALLEHFLYVTAETITRHAAAIAAAVETLVEIDADQVVSGEFPTARIADDAVTTAKIAELNVTTALIAAQAAGYVDAGNQGSLAYSSTSYADIAAHGYTPRRSASRLLVVGFCFNSHTAGNNTFALRRGTTVIGDENAYALTSPVILAAIDTGHGGSNSTWNLSVKASAGGSGTAVFAKVVVIDIA